MAVKDLETDRSPAISAGRRSVASTYDWVVRLGKMHRKDALECEE